VHKRIATLLGLLALAIAGIWFVRRGGSTGRAEGRKEEEAPADTDPSARVAEPPPPFRSSALPVTPAPPGPELDRARSDAMRAAIHAFFAGASPSSRPPSPPSAMPNTDDGGVLGDYIRERVHEDLFPLAEECYVRALKKNPTLAGKLVVSFTIAGDRRVGGVVDSAEIDPSSDLADPEMSDCVKESMMSVAFGAPPDGLPTVSVTYPIVFAPGDEPDAS
jgi:hypothetical protein